ncbi:AraC family transcriptional regulator [Paenibacillus soyae]|uniref:AraC family transcriptional regulator n=1 Tax=Paenibacillus soyae TaxID=2969249 RepID=A0A9X2MME7_9BACL|nr:AraC family transcriptional regulator [Paenibacillus soyae]MCR2802306.1 AraC family transcriptional regulator [Paenibacillus soyae]
MRFFSIRQNGKLYIRLLLGITVSVSLFLMVSSFVYFFAFSRILQEKAFESDLRNLQQTSRTVAKTTESAQTVSFQIYRNSSIAKILYYSEPNAFDVQAAMIDLGNYLSSMPFIHSIYVYNSAQERYYIAAQNGQRGIIGEDELMDASIASILEDYQQYRPFAPIPRTIMASERFPEETAVYTYLCYDAIGLEQQINSAVIVNVSAEWINRELGSNGGGRTFLIDDRNAILSVDDLQSSGLDTEDAAIIHASAQKEESGFRIAELQGVRTLLSRTSPDQYGWQYVRMTPYEEIVKETKELRAKTLQIASLILAIGLLLSWLLSRYLYAPINQIESRVADLESERRNTSYAIRQNALLKLIQIQDFNPQVQLEKLKRIGISFDFTKPYRLAFMRLDRFKESESLQSKDLVTFKFAIMNIATEISSRQYGVDAVDLGDDGILLLLNVPEHASSELAPIGDMLAEIQNACQEYIRMGLTIAVTPPSSRPEELHALYKQVKEATLHRFFRGRACIVETDELQLEPVTKYAFPVAKEKRMLDALMSGKTDEAKLQFDDILSGTSSYPIAVAASASAHLAVSLGNMLAEIERNGLTRFGSPLRLTPPRFEDYETLEEMTDGYYRFFDELKDTLVAKRSSRQEDLILRITEMIDTRFADPNLSLNFIAEQLDMSTYHISRIYRQQTLTTIVDMINQVRIGKAKELLGSTELSVAEIAEQTGYTSSSYLHRIFKKLNGVTPAEYRSAHSAKQQPGG